jgi:NADP-dependent 3-hydroxy acid dehydrogenase YdfG
MRSIIVITGASSGFGALAARALAIAGHTVYASMRETTGRNASQVEAVEQFAKENNVDLRAIELDVASQESADQAIRTIVEKDGRLDVVIHNAGHMVFGAAEALLRNNWYRSLTPMCSARNVSTEPLCHNCVNRREAWSFGSEAPARAVARRLTFHPTLRRRQLWMRSLSAMPQS